MARFDVYSTADSSLVLNLQSNAFENVNTRIVAPLLLKSTYDRPINRANPEFVIEREHYVLLTHFLAAVMTSELRQKIDNLEHEHYKISSAPDMLFYGF